MVLDEGCVSLPIKFTPKNPGHYPCRVVLRSPNDIRVYLIECTVNPEGTAAQIEFTAPVHQSVSQEIPVVCIMVFYVLLMNDSSCGNYLFTFYSGNSLTRKIPDNTQYFFSNTMRFNIITLLNNTKVLITQSKFQSP